jgi:hypothetical protein
MNIVRYCKLEPIAVNPQSLEAIQDHLLSVHVLLKTMPGFSSRVELCIGT